MSSSGTYILGGGGMSNVLTLTPQSGGSVSPIGGNINIIPTTGATGVLTTINGGANNLDIGFTSSLDGQLIIGATAGNPSWATLTAGTGITITNAPNSITIDATGAGSIQTLDGNSGSASGSTVNIISDITQGTALVTGDNANTLTITYSDSVNNNTALGNGTLFSFMSGTSNTAFGSATMDSLTTGSENTAIGRNALDGVATGSGNIALGYNSGTAFTTTESNNITIGNSGVIADSGVTRIGTNATQTEVFIAGIDGVDVGSVATVVTEASDQLGTAVLTAGTGISITPGANTITIAASGGGGGTTVTTFDTSGTWTMGGSTKYVKVFGWNGGGGGGSGGFDNTATVSGGGSGGAAGGCFYYEAPALYFPASVTVTIGAGGTGGAAAGVNGPGNNGSPGGQTSFGNMFVPINANEGLAGTANGTDASGVTAGSVAYLQSTALFGTNGVSGIGSGTTFGGNASNEGGAVTNGNYFLTATDGGGGGGEAGTTGQAAGNGGAVIALDNSTVLLAGGAGAPVSSNGNPGLNATTTFGFITGGTGGGGGGGDRLGNAGNGGNGGIPGGGGGGGGGGWGDPTTGVGGNGGHGRIIVVELS